MKKPTMDFGKSLLAGPLWFFFGYSTVFAQILPPQGAEYNFSPKSEQIVIGQSQSATIVGGIDNFDYASGNAGSYDGLYFDMTCKLSNHQNDTANLLLQFGMRNNDGITPYSALDGTWRRSYRVLLRKDKPTDNTIAIYLKDNLSTDNPHQRADTDSGSGFLKEQWTTTWPLFPMPSLFGSGSNTESIRLQIYVNEVITEIIISDAFHPLKRQSRQILQFGFGSSLKQQMIAPAGPNTVAITNFCADDYQWPVNTGNKSLVKQTMSVIALQNNAEYLTPSSHVNDMNVRDQLAFKRSIYGASIAALSTEGLTGTIGMYRPPWPLVEFPAKAAAVISILN